MSKYTLRLDVIVDDAHCRSHTFEHLKHKLERVVYEMMSPSVMFLREPVKAEPHAPLLAEIFAYKPKETEEGTDDENSSDMET